MELENILISCFYVWELEENKLWESYHRVKLHTLSMGVKQNKAVTLPHCDCIVHCYALDRGPSDGSCSCLLLLSKHWMPLVFFWLKIVTYLHNTFLSIWLTVEGWKEPGPGTSKQCKVRSKAKRWQMGFMRELSPDIIFNIVCWGDHSWIETCSLHTNPGHQKQSAAAAP